MISLTNTSTISGACVYPMSECIQLCFDPSSCTVSAGAAPFVTFRVKGGAQADGLPFTIANVGFVIDNSIDSNTATSVRLTDATADINARRIKSMIESNPTLGPNVTVSMTTTGADVDVSVVFKKRLEINPLTTSFPAFAPAYTIVSESIGADIDILPCCELSYSVWQVSSLGTLTKVSLDYRFPFTNGTTGTPVSNCLDINSIIKPLMGVSFPFNSGVWKQVQTDSTAYKRFLVRFRRSTCPDGCGAVLEQETDSPIFRVLNAYLAQEDVSGLCQYNNEAVLPGAPVRPFLTERPVFEACSVLPDWLYVLQTELTSVQNYILRFETAPIGSSTFTLLGDVTVPGVTGGAVSRLPVGLANLPTSLPAMPAGTGSYRVSLMDSTGVNTHSRAVFTIVNTGCLCASDSATFYFLNKFGAVDRITFCGITEVSIEGTHEIECQPVPCISAGQESDTGIESGYINNLNSRMATGQYRTISSDFYRRFTATAENIPGGAAGERFVQSFLTSPRKYVLFRDSLGNTVLRQVYVEVGGRVVRRAAGEIDLSINWFFTKNDERHI